MPLPSQHGTGGTRGETSDAVATRPQRGPKLVPNGEGQTKKGLRHVDVNPFAASVPETGLEPARPMRSPGPQPGASANSATPARTGCCYLTGTPRLKSSP